VTQLIKIAAVAPLHDRWLRITFSDRAIFELASGTRLRRKTVRGPTMAA
jgi:hypothetical protein